MQTKDPALTKTLIVDKENERQGQPHVGDHHRVGTETLHDASLHNDPAHDHDHKGTETFQETVIGTLYTSDHIFDDVIHEHEDHLHGQYDSALPHDEAIHHGDHRVQRALDESKNTATFQETVVGSGYVPENHIDKHPLTPNTVTSSDLNHDISGNNGIENDPLHESVVESEHVYEGDLPARQPDRRDQKGSAFDEGINEHSVGNETLKSDRINDMNRYASLDNAQTRVLNPDEK